MCVHRVRSATSFHMDRGTEERWTFLCGSQGAKQDSHPGSLVQTWNDGGMMFSEFIFSPWELQCKLSKSCFEVNEEFWWVLTGLLQVLTLRIMMRQSDEHPPRREQSLSWVRRHLILHHRDCPLLCVRPYAWGPKSMWLLNVWMTKF